MYKCRRPKNDGCKYYGSKELKLWDLKNDYTNFDDYKNMTVKAVVVIIKSFAF